MQIKHYTSIYCHSKSQSCSILIVVSYDLQKENCSFLYKLLVVLFNKFNYKYIVHFLRDGRGCFGICKVYLCFGIPDFSFSFFRFVLIVYFLITWCNSDQCFQASFCLIPETCLFSELKID